jgi:hypothetical protein
MNSFRVCGEPRIYEKVNSLQIALTKNAERGLFEEYARTAEAIWRKNRVYFLSRGVVTGGFIRKRDSASPRF